MSGPFEQIQHSTRTIAMVGASNKEDRPSYRVLRFLLAHGYRVIPVNPGLAGQEIRGCAVAGSLADISEQVDMVEIFRNTDDATKVVDEAIALKDRLGLKTVWCQLGVTPVEAGKRAEAAGLTFVMDHCPAIEWR